jgi:hypothetical protein
MFSEQTLQQTGANWHALRPIQFNLRTSPQPFSQTFGLVSTVVIERATADLDQ